MRSDVKRETLRMIVVARDCKVSLRLMMRLTMMLTTDSANVSLCSNPRHWWPETLVTTALCNLQKNGWRHGKHKICQKSFTNNIFMCWFAIFLNCFPTSSLHISTLQHKWKSRVVNDLFQAMLASSFRVHWSHWLMLINQSKELRQCDMCELNNDETTSERVRATLTPGEVPW